MPMFQQTAAWNFEGRTIDEKDVGRALGVKYLLEGTVRKAPDRVHIGVELIDASSAAEIWAQRYDRPLKRNRR
jgi:adenylate cyclase